MIVNGCREVRDHDHQKGAKYDPDKYPEHKGIFDAAVVKAQVKVAADAKAAKKE